jgi:hypothetical protein
MKLEIVFSLLVLIRLTVLPGLHAQEEKYIGLFVYNFSKYFDWPESTKTEDFTIQVLGHKSVADELVKVTLGKKVGTQNIIIQDISTPEQINSRSEIIFIGHWHSRYLPSLLDKVGNGPTLIITEMEGLLDQGSAINFIIRDGSIKFEMKASNVNSHQLKTDPRIRELAYKVVD